MAGNIRNFALLEEGRKGRGRKLHQYLEQLSPNRSLPESSNAGPIVLSPSDFLEKDHQVSDELAREGNGCPSRKSVPGWCFFGILLMIDR